MVATTIKQYAWVLAAMMALSAALAVLSPDIAEAQSPEDAVMVSTLPESDTQVQDNAAMPQQQPIYEPATLRVVNPGDSLWAISQERLQPDPTPEQIVNEVGRIYEFNRDRLGDDPNLIFPGQELLLPPVVVAEFAVSEEPEISGLGVSEPVTASELAVSEELVTPEPAVSEEPAASQESETSEPVASEPAVSEELVTPEPAVSEEPAASQESETSEPIASEPATPEQVTGGGRQLLGLGILALTLVIAILMVWRLPMKRDTDGPVVWGIPRGYHEDHRHDPEPVKDLKERKSGTASESLETARGPDSPAETKNAAPASAGSEETVYQPFSARRRRERLRTIPRLRRIHQRTNGQRRLPPNW